MDLMVTTNQKPITHTQKRKKKKHKHYTKGSHQITSEIEKKEQRTIKNNQKTINTMDISICLSIITLNGNRQEQKTQGGRMDEKSKIHIYASDPTTHK